MIIVTGASGKIGCELLRLLAERGVGVKALSRHPPRDVQLPGVAWVTADLAERRALPSIFAGAERLFATVLGTLGTLALLASAVLWWFAEPVVALQFPRFDPETLLGVRRRYAEYRGGAAELRAGTFYATFGRGLLLFPPGPVGCQDRLDEEVVGEKIRFPARGGDVSILESLIQRVPSARGSSGASQHAWSPAGWKNRHDCQQSGR